MTSSEVTKLEIHLEGVKAVLDNVQDNMHNILESQKSLECRLRAVETDVMGLKIDLRWMKQLKYPLYASGIGSSLMAIIYGLVQVMLK